MKVLANVDNFKCANFQRYKRFFEIGKYKFPKLYFKA